MRSLPFDLRLTARRTLPAAAWLLSLLSLLGSSSPAAAGVREIDQLCAVSGGCFPGDSGGFPVTITQPGTYRLTSNLDVRGAASPQNATAIDITHTADGLLLDLNGFALLGPNTCAAPPSGCTANGTGNGVRSTADGTEVRDGSVVGFGAHGVSIVARGVRVDRVRAWYNGANGIETEFDSAVVADSAAFRNGNDGFHIDSGSTTGSTAVQNTQDGFYLAGTSSASELNAWANGENGVDFSYNLKLSFSVSNANLGAGFSGHVFACVADANGTYGIWQFSAFNPYGSTLQSVYASNAVGSIGPVVTSLARTPATAAAVEELAMIRRSDPRSGRRGRFAAAILVLAASPAIAQFTPLPDPIHS